MNLEDFGKTLKKLRTEAGLSQKDLLDRLSEIHNKTEPGPLGITSQLLGNWERAYTHRGRRWVPSRRYTLYLIEAFADQLTLEEAQHWTSNAGYSLHQSDLKTFFLTNLDWPPAQAPQLPSQYVERQIFEASLVDQLRQAKLQTLILWGPGGIGKTTLAVSLAKAVAAEFPDGVIWIPVQPQDTAVTLLEQIADSLEIILGADDVAKRARKIHSRLQKRRCLLVLDDLTALPELLHLNFGSAQSRLICTTRDIKVAQALQMPPTLVPGLTPEEGVRLLTHWTGQQVKAQELVTRLGGLPLALSLVGAQLQSGLSLDFLLTAFRDNGVDLSVLDMDEAEARFESLIACFDLSYRQLQPDMKTRFDQIGYFAGRRFHLDTLAAVWGVGQLQARKTIQALVRHALLTPATANGEEQTYAIHPLLYDYAHHHLSQKQYTSQSARYRHAAWHIRYALYHPAILPDNDTPAPNLDHTWADVVAGVRWATEHDSPLGTMAALLAHTERPALLEAVGEPLITAVSAYLDTLTDPIEQILIMEQLGDLLVLQGGFAAGLYHLAQARDLWGKLENGLASGRILLRMACVSLLLEDHAKAADLARQAQTILRQFVPISSGDAHLANTIFYWFNMVYRALIRWADLPEADITDLVELTKHTRQRHLQALGTHIHALFCLVDDIDRGSALRQQGYDLTLKAYQLWRDCQQKERADSIVSFGKFYLKRRFSRYTARRFARRRSRYTPLISPAQFRIIPSEGIRWWLQATDDQRIDWLSWMLPRYLNAINRPLQPATRRMVTPLEAGSRAYRWVEDILDIGMLGTRGRRLMKGLPRPDHHFIDSTEWQVFTGQKILSPKETEAQKLIYEYLQRLDQMIRLDR